MDINNYNMILRCVDDNIKDERHTLISKLTRTTYMGADDLNDFFRLIDSENRTILEYIRQRKIEHALKDFADGRTKADVVDDYSLNDRTFNYYVKLLNGGKVPSYFRENGYDIPELEFVAVKRHSAEGVEEPEQNFDIEENSFDMRNSIKELQEENTILSKQVEDIEKMLIQEKANKIISREKANKKITITEYYNFLKIERLRKMYGFEVGQMMELYSESIIEGKDLEYLCDDALDTFRFEPEEYEYSTDYPDPEDEEEWEEFFEEEGTLMENWEYYFGDDEILDGPRDDDEDIWF